MSIGTVAACWRYPVKSMQGVMVDELVVTPSGVRDDRHHAVVETSSGRVLSAKRVARLLEAAATDDAITLPDRQVLALEGEASELVDAALSAWLERPVTLAQADGASGMAYDMTFDPPNDDAEYFEIPMPEGTFLDLAALHVLTTTTLGHCQAARPDLDWDIRRFRPNLVLDVAGDGFVEDEWTGRRLRVGGAVLEVMGPTVRCAMPLRAQPALAGSPALGREPALFKAMSDLHAEVPNHLGAYASVAEPGPVRVGDNVELLPSP
jgi:uncharacterized protein YcbX